MHTCTQARIHCISSTGASVCNQVHTSQSTQQYLSTARLMRSITCVSATVLHSVLCSVLHRLRCKHDACSTCCTSQRLHFASASVPLVTCMTGNRHQLQLNCACVCVWHCASCMHLQFVACMLLPCTCSCRYCCMHVAQPALALSPLADLIFYPSLGLQCSASLPLTTLLSPCRITAQAVDAAMPMVEQITGGFYYVASKVYKTDRAPDISAYLGGHCSQLSLSR